MRKRVTKLAAIFMAMVLAFSGLTAFAQSPEEAGLLPVRAFFESIGGEVSWDSEERAVVVEIDGGFIAFLSGVPMAIVNGQPTEMATGLVLYNSVSFITEEDLFFLLEVFLETLGVEMLLFELTEEARDLVLEDFDYLIALIDDNSAWSNIIYRSLGFDFGFVAEMVRGFIYDMEPINLPIIDMDILLEHFPIHAGETAQELAANYLFALLMFDLAPALGGIGHLGPRDLTSYGQLLDIFLNEVDGENFESHYLAQLLVEVYTHPTAVWFYGGEAAEMTIPPVSGNIETESIVPGEIAYLRMHSFMADPDYDDAIILPFLQQIADYDHLIIDLRTNFGGLAATFPRLFFSRLITEPTIVRDIQFFSDGDLAARWVQATIDTSWALDDGTINYIELLPAADFVAEQGMRYFRDLDALSYVLISSSTVYPCEDSDVTFSGQIWILVDEMSMSAPVAAALLAYNTDFAIIVGTNTSGVMGSVHSYSVLPNTGIIWRIDLGHRTDALGRSLEVYGVAPHHHIDADEDALEVVLELIAQG